MRSLLINPVLNKEIKLRFRSFKSFLGILFYLLVLGGIALGYIYLDSSNSPGGIVKPNESQEMFMIISVLQLGLILFMTPGLTAGTISGERERQTLNILLTTQQSSTSIIVSKLVSSLAYLFLIIFSSLPLYSIVFLFGGVSPNTLISVFVIYLLTIVTVGSIGILFSTLIRKTIVSMIVTYGVMLFLTAGTAAIMLFSFEMSGYSYNANPQHTNVVAYICGMFNPFAVILAELEPNAANEFADMTNIDFSLFISFTFSYLSITVISLLISIMKLRPKMKPKRG
ncbi:ABC transporter permease [Cytobacillus sp. Hm23]